MIIDKIEGTPSLAVRQHRHDRTWYLVRRRDHTEPEVISVRPGNNHVWLDHSSPLRNRILRAVVNEHAFVRAVEYFRTVQTLHSDFGAHDTEPRGQFVDMLERIANGEPAQVPNANTNGWQLYSSLPGYRTANADLTKAARVVVKAAKADRKGLLTWLKDNYGIEVW